jgi:hypothetical protein
MNDETSTNYSGQTEEENNKNTNNENTILYSNINEDEWQKEFNKVSNMLEITEVSDEYFGSFSESSSNKNDQNKTEGNYQTVKHIKNISKLFNNKFIDDIKNLELYNENIENELNKINNKESLLSNKNKGLKEELNKLKITKQANKQYQDEYDIINKNIKKKEIEKNNIEAKLQKIKKDEKKIMTFDDKTKLQKTRKGIENLVEDNNKIDEEISLLNTVIINKYSNLMYNNFVYNNNDNNNNFGFDGKNNDINNIMENIKENEDVFGEDEII